MNTKQRVNLIGPSGLGSRESNTLVQSVSFICFCSRTAECLAAGTAALRCFALAFRSGASSTSRFVSLKGFLLTFPQDDVGEKLSE